MEVYKYRPLPIFLILKISFRNYIKMNSLQFNVIDYVIFIISLLVPIFVGFYFAFCGTKHATERVYLYGNKNVNPSLVGLSLFSR